MRKHRAGSVWMILPLYLFTLIFVALPLLYVVALSFSTADGGYGVNWKFTLDNYKQILEPVYLQTFTGSFRLALTSTLIICLVGYPFGYFMAKLSEGKKKLAMLFLMLPFWVNSLIRLYGWIIILQKKGLLNYLLMKLGIIQEPLKILYSYPAIVIGMIYVLLPFMALSVYSSAEKLDWSLVEAARDLGASRWKAFWSVTFKLTLPGLLSGVILTFIPSMGLFFIADILGNLIHSDIVALGPGHHGLGHGDHIPVLQGVAVCLLRRIDTVYHDIDDVVPLADDGASDASGNNACHGHVLQYSSRIGSFLPKKYRNYYTGMCPEWQVLFWQKRGFSPGFFPVRRRRGERSLAGAGKFLYNDLKNQKGGPCFAEDHTIQRVRAGAHPSPQ